MKNYIKLLFIFLIIPIIGIAQEDDTKKKKVIDKPERPAFESATLIDNPTNVLFKKNTLEIMMQHRFDLIESNNTLLGIYGAANIRIAASYAIIDRLTVGFGTTKDRRLQDFNLKGAILQQTRSGKIPLSISYYGNFTIDARPMSPTDSELAYRQDRYSFFNQIIIARRFNRKFSAFVSPSISHINRVKNGMKNDMFGLAIGGRYKITDGTSIVVDYSQPLTKNDQNNPNPGFSIGFEFGTSAHTFSIFATNNKAIVPQYNYMYNQNDFFGTGANTNDGRANILVGFNITRNYNF